VTVTTADDIGALTAEIVFAEPRFVNQVVHVAGDTITYRQLADTVDSMLNRNVRRVEWSVPELERELAQEPGNSIRKYRAVFAAGKGVAWDKSRTFNAQRGISACGIEDWMRQNVLTGVDASLQRA